MRRPLHAVHQRARPTRGLARDPGHLAVCHLRARQHHPSDPPPGRDESSPGCASTPGVARGFNRALVPRARVASHGRFDVRGPRPAVPRVPALTAPTGRHGEHLALVRRERGAERGVRIDGVCFGVHASDLHVDGRQPRAFVVGGDVRELDAVEDAGGVVPREVVAVVVGAERHMPESRGRGRGWDGLAVPAAPIDSGQRAERCLVHRPREAVGEVGERVAAARDPRVHRGVVLVHQLGAKVVRGEVRLDTRQRGEDDREAEEDDDGAEVVEEVAAPAVARSHHVRARAPAVLLANQDDRHRWIFTPDASAGRGARSALSSHLSEVVLSGAIPDMSRLKKRCTRARFSLNRGSIYKRFRLFACDKSYNSGTCQAEAEKECKRESFPNQKKELLRNISQM